MPRRLSRRRGRPSAIGVVKVACPDKVDPPDPGLVLDLTALAALLQLVRACNWMMRSSRAIIPGGGAWGASAGREWCPPPCEHAPHHGTDALEVCRNGRWILSMDVTVGWAGRYDPESAYRRPADRGTPGSDCVTTRRVQCGADGWFCARACNDDQRPTLQGDGWRGRQRCRVDSRQVIMIMISAHQYSTASALSTVSISSDR